MINTKRLGKYHHHINNNNDNSTFNEPPSLYKDNSSKPLLDLDKPLFGYKRASLQKLLANANKTIEKSTKLINKIETRDLACVNRFKSIPENATIRKEYIKCGKEMCELKHGPYYYAYWKDPESKKLKKKYIGDHMPKNQQFEGNFNNN